MVRYPYHYFEDSYYASNLLEENGRIHSHEKENEDYWIFLNPSIYDSSRFRSVVLNISSHICFEEHDHEIFYGIRM